MRTRLQTALPLCAICLAGCMTSPYGRPPAPTWKLSPQLAMGVPLAVCVQDRRPVEQTEKQPSTEYLYSGSLFAVDGNSRTVARAIAELISRSGGAAECEVVEAPPSKGVVVSFDLRDWYSRTLLKPEKGPLFVRGAFGGTLTLLRDGVALASAPIHADGVTSVIDTHIVFEREKQQTPQLIWNAMECTANSAEQDGYGKLMDALQQHWHVFSTP